MEKWNKPQIVDLGAQYTEGGDLGGGADGVAYEFFVSNRRRIMIGTSGPHPGDGFTAISS